MLVNPRERAMTFGGVALQNLMCLRDRLLLAAAEELGSAEVILDERRARIDEIGIELHRALEFRFRSAREARPREDAGVHRLLAEFDAAAVVLGGSLLAECVRAKKKRE